MENDYIKGRTVLITGATDGIGFETALQLAGMGAKVLVHGRRKEKCIQAVEKIARETCNENISLYLADFSSFEDIQRMAAEIKREQDALHVLVNNAGNFYRARKLSKDGIEMSFAVNHLAPLLLTMSLLDLIKNSAPARIINVSSSSHKMVKEVDFENLQGESEYDGFGAYALAKLGTMLVTQVLSEKLVEDGVLVNALHPGVVATKLQKKSYGLEGISITEGAKTQIMLAASPAMDGVTGKYFQNEKERAPSDLSTDKEIQRQFWQVSMDLIGDYLK